MADNTEQELIVPKKLINPVKESGTMRELHRELLFNQKIGKSVLNQKSELQRVMESKRLKMKSNGNDDQIQLGLGQDNNQLSNSTNSNNEFLNVHRRITSHNNQVQD